MPRSQFEELLAALPGHVVAEIKREGDVDRLVKVMFS